MKSRRQGTQIHISKYSNANKSNIFLEPYSVYNFVFAEPRNGRLNLNQSESISTQTKERYPQPFSFVL